MSSWVQLIYLLAFIFSAYIIVSMLFSVIMLFTDSNIDPNNIVLSVDQLRINQILSGIVLLLPAFLWSYLFNGNVTEVFKINKMPAWQFIPLSLVLIIIIQPFIGFLGYYNEQMVLPESLSSIEKFMRAREDTATALMEQLFADKSTYSFILNLIIIALVAGICEEFFFRGTLQQIINKITNNYHIAVWVTAFIFSFIHLQFYGFFPRLVLGALLGYLFVWSGSLWIPMFVHILNNSFAVVLNQKIDKPTMEEIEYFGVGNTLWATIVSIAVTVLIMIYMSRSYLRNRIEEGQI